MSGGRGGAITPEARACRRFIIANLGDRALVARYILRAVHRRTLSDREIDPFLDHLFRCRETVDFYACVVAFLSVTGGRPVDATYAGGSESSRSTFTMIHDWAAGCLARNEKSMPPVNATSGMAFVATVLDQAELHLRSIRALPEADKVSMLRGMVDAVFQSRSGTWVLASSFLSHVGHLVYAATLVELQRRGRVSGSRIGIRHGQSQNGFLRRQFESRVLDSVPADSPYTEMISARKRYRMSDGRWSTMSELVSEAASLWASVAPFATLDPEIRKRGDAVLAGLGVPPDAPVVTLHVREGGFHGGVAAMMSLRDSRIADYRDAVAYLAGTGTCVIRLGDRSMTPAEPQDGFVDYPFTAAKSEWMDVYLASRCRFHIGTSSGMSFVPLMFGRPVLFTNWTTLSHTVCSPSVVTLPKVLLDPDGRVVPLAEYCARHGHIFERSDATLHGLSFRDNAPEDILDAVRLMDRHVAPGSGRLAPPPGLFAGAQAVFAASPLKIRPQIPPGFWRRHYAAG